MGDCLLIAGVLILDVRMLIMNNGLIPNSQVLLRGPRFNLREVRYIHLRAHFLGKGMSPPLLPPTTC